MREEILQNLIQAIVTNTNIPKEDITINSTFEELGMDSLDSMSVITNLENLYNIILPNEAVMKIRTVLDAVNALEEHVSQNKIYAKE